MKVKCIGTLGKDLSPKALSVSGFKTSNFQLELDASYVVYGISLYKGILHYLTFDRWKTFPFWFPSELFIIEDPSIPADWYFIFFSPPTEGGLEALWGYKELAIDSNYYDNLIEREDDAINTFLKRKEEIDNWISKNDLS